MLYEYVVRPILFLQDPERIHDRAVWLGKVMGTTALTRWKLSLLYEREHPELSQKILGITFRNPVGLAAGFDKDCQLMPVLPCMGFGFEEVGSITKEAYEGNQGRRLVRLTKDEGIVVYYGLKNKGAAALKPRLKGPFRIPIGVSVAKTNKAFPDDEAKYADWVGCIKQLKDCGDYLTINLSCPNTHEKTNYCDPRQVDILLARIQEARIRFTKPVFLKIAMDISTKELDRIIAVCDRFPFVKGFVISNLSKDRSQITLKTPKHVWEHQKGGISGPVVKPFAITLVRHAYKRAGDRYVIIGCGGISTAEDAYAYIRSGASLVQLITGMIYHGPATVKRINKGLVRLLKRDGYTHLAQAVGADVRRRR